MARHRSLIEGRWRIVETELWDQEALDLVVPAYMRFDRNGLGEMELIAIGASIDYRVEQRDGAFVLEFSWSGFDEMDATSGRAWARIDGDTIRGKLLIHQGDESTFVARRERVVRGVSTTKTPRPPGGAAPYRNVVDRANAVSATWRGGQVRWPTRRRRSGPPGDRSRGIGRANRG